MDLRCHLPLRISGEGADGDWQPPPIGLTRSSQWTAAAAVGSS